MNKCFLVLAVLNRALMLFGDFICLAQAKAHLAHSLSKHLLSIAFVLGPVSTQRSQSCVERRRSLGEDSITPPQRQPYPSRPMRNEQKTLLNTFFYVDNFLKVLIEFVTMLLLFCVLVFWPLGKWDLGVSLVAQRVNNPPAMQETRLGSLGRDDPLEKRMATHSRIFAWGIPWTEFTVHGVAKSQTQLSG